MFRQFLPHQKKAVSVVEGGAEGETPRTKDRLKQWEEGVSSPTRPEQGTAKAPIKPSAEGDVDGVKDRMNKWSEVTKDPEQPMARKEPLNIYTDSNYQQ